MRSSDIVLVLAVLGSACARSSQASSDAQRAPVDAPAAPAAKAEAAAPKEALAEAVAEPAALGKPAPDFTLTDLEGKTVKLSEFRGKTVVLEWFNPECPFVKASHSKGSLVGAAERHAKSGVVWLAINSGAPGKQGAGRDNSAAGRERFGLKHPVLLDESGSVGKLYGAKTTPHLFVIAADGTLVYRGAIDNSPDGEGDSPEGGKLVNYVDEAIAAIQASKPVAHADTKPYGCSVKYLN